MSTCPPVADDQTATEPRPRPDRSTLDRLKSVRPASWVTAAVVTSCVVFTALQLRPDLLMADTTPAGGDMGAHVWAPAYLRDHLLPNWRLTGWTPDWYGGFPALHFYMVPPMLAIVLLDLVLPYGIAFKLVTVSGLVTLPVAAWAFGRLAGMRHPAPALLAIGSLGFLFDRTYSILGGNIASTLAGEFAFSISLSLAVLYLGFVANGLQTGRHRALAAGLVALCGLTHVIPLFFAIAGTFVLLALYASKPALRWVAASGIVGGLLAMWWLLPFWWQRAYMNDMGWQKQYPPADAGVFEEAGFWLTRIFPAETRWVAVVAIIGLVAAIRRRSTPGLFLVAMLVIGSAAFVVVPQGRLWNERLLPFVYLCTYLLAAFGVAELLRWGTERITDPMRSALRGGLALVAVGSLRTATRMPFAPDGDYWHDAVMPVLNVVMVLGLIYGFAELVRWIIGGLPADNRRTVQAGAVVLVLAAALITVALPLRALPGGRVGSDGTYRWLGVISTDDRSFIPSWTEWNYSGYERKSAWPELEDVVITMGNLGERNGCGRAMWEYERETLNAYGTPMALMLLPHWTGGCIGSMEGLYFESASMTPYHFLNQSALSESPSRAQRNMPYRPFDIDLGVRQLQLTGVRYYMAQSALAISAASNHPELTELARSGPWVVFEVDGAPLVEPLRYEPVVLDGVDDAMHEWVPATVDWFQHPPGWDVLWASDGPGGWQRSETPDQAERRAQRAISVTDVRSDSHSISFEVSEPGVPVLVKTPYFPNWQASGADGPWRVSPTFMVVLPTENTVELTYGRAPIELASWGLTAIGGVGLVWLARSTPPDMPRWRRDDDLVDEDDDLLEEGDDVVEEGDDVVDDPGGGDHRFEPDWVSPQ